MPSTACEQAQRPLWWPRKRLLGAEHAPQVTALPSHGLGDAFMCLASLLTKRTSLPRENETCEKPDKTLSTCVLMLTPTKPEPPQLNGTSQAAGPGFYFRLCHIICKFSIPSKRSPVPPSLSWLNGKQKFTDNLGTSFLPSCFSLLPLRWSTEGLMGTFFT